MAARSALTQQGEEHGVGAVPVRPQLQVRATGGVGHLGQHTAGVDHLNALCAFDHLGQQGTPGAPRVTIRGFSLWGRVGIKSKKRKPPPAD